MGRQGSPSGTRVPATPAARRRPVQFPTAPSVSQGEAEASERAPFSLSPACLCPLSALRSFLSLPSNKNKSLARQRPRPPSTLFSAPDPEVPPPRAPITNRGAPLDRQASPRRARRRWEPNEPLDASASVSRSDSRHERGTRPRPDEHDQQTGSRPSEGARPGRSCRSFFRQSIVSFDSLYHALSGLGSRRPRDRLNREHRQRLRQERRPQLLSNKTRRFVAAERQPQLDHLEHRRLDETRERERERTHGRTTRSHTFASPFTSSQQQ